MFAIAGLNLSRWCEYYHGYELYYAAIGAQIIDTAMLAVKIIFVRRDGDGE